MVQSRKANRDGNTALHVAAQENFLPIVEVLLAHISHAKYVDKQNKMGVTPPMLAVTITRMLELTPEKRTVPDEEGGFQTPVTLAETFELDAPSDSAGLLQSRWIVLNSR